MKRYSQVEKEALAVVWACEKLHLYLYGREFKLITDNRAVQLIFENPKSNPPLRIRRMALRLMSYNFTIKHKPGSENIADVLSRHPLESSKEDNNIDETESYVAFISTHATPLALTKEQIINKTALDERLATLAKIIRNELVNNQDLAKSVKEEFKQVLSELTVTSEGLILRDTRLIIPSSLQSQVLKIAHDGHQGISKTKSLLRTKVWFTGINQKVEELIEKCKACQVNVKTSTAQPIKPTPMPLKPWEYLAMDFYEPLPNGQELMVVVDEFSRMPVIGEVKTTAAEHVLPKLDDLFSFVGKPEELKTDNGPPFNGAKFREFAEFYG